MTLTERIAAAAVRPDTREVRVCTLAWCHDEAMRDALLCRRHVTDDYMGRLPAWRKRLTARDETGAVVA